MKLNNSVPLSQKLASYDLNHVFSQILSVLPMEEQERSGGFLTIYHGFAGHTSYEMFGCMVGKSVPVKKAEKYRVFSAEKALRLALHHDHVSSFQSRNEENDKWPGAVRKNKESDIFSFSGLPWKADEALVLIVCIGLGEMTFDEAFEIARISDNDVYRALLGDDKSLRNDLFPTGLATRS